MTPTARCRQLDGGAKPYGLRTPLHCSVGMAVAPLLLGGCVRRGVVRDPAGDLSGKLGQYRAGRPEHICQLAEADRGWRPP